MVGSPSYEGLRFGPHSVGRDYGSFVLIVCLVLIAIAGNVFLSYWSHLLRVQCALGCGVEVARGAEALG